MGALSIKWLVRMAYKKGMIVKPGYGQIFFVVKKVFGPCTCPAYLDSINMPSPPKSRAHYHLHCKAIGEPKSEWFYLNGYDGNGKNVWDGDQLEVIDWKGKQLTITNSL